MDKLFTGWGFFILVIVFMVIGVIVNQAVYDGDLRCLVAECRIMKK